MQKILILPLSVYRLKLKMHFLQSKIQKMESADYLNLQNRMELAQMKKMLVNLHEHEAELHSHTFTIGF